MTQLLNRDMSLLAFNRRVLSLAMREDYPLLERLRFLSIVALNLDEFFEVRMEAQLEAASGKRKDVNVTPHTFAMVSAEAHALTAEQYRIFDEVLMPVLDAQGVRLIPSERRTAVQNQFVQEYFEQNVKPLLLPIALDPAHPFPQVANKALNFIVELDGVDAFGRDNSICILRVPRTLPRIVRLPDEVSEGKQCFVLLTSIIRTNLPTLFPGRNILHASQFRVTRNSDLEVDEEDVSDLRMALRQELVHRQFGQAVRLEVSHTCPKHMADFLLKQFALPEPALYRVNGPVNLGRLIQLPDMVDADALKFEPHTPQWPRQLTGEKSSFFDRLKQGDVLIHRPYESFEAVIAFLEEAVNDPNVLSIQQTIYRTGADPRMLNLLQEAVRKGKEVLAVVELKARFDEEANINWAEALESVGAQVVYGIVGLKTHAKMLLVMRREGRFIKRYGHLSTGNYNPKTAKLYTDIGMLTQDLTITREMESVFRHLTAQVPLPRMRRLLVAPFTLHQTMLRYVRRASIAASRGKHARIMLKVNSLTDEALVHALLEAARNGVQIDLVVRGANILPIDDPRLGGRIQLRSVVGRFLEHSRVFWFEIDTRRRVWLSSADWMSRNMFRRVEIAWPIHDVQLQEYVWQMCLEPYLKDNKDAWGLGEQGQYHPLRIQHDKSADAKLVSAQEQLMKIYRESV
jgi:polyphosphate kinase